MPPGCWLPGRVLLLSHWVLLLLPDRVLMSLPGRVVLLPHWMLVLLPDRVLVLLPNRVLMLLSGTGEPTLHQRQVWQTLRCQETGCQVADPLLGRKRCEAFGV